MRRSSSRTDHLGQTNRRDTPTLAAAGQPKPPPELPLSQRASTVLDPRLSTLMNPKLHGDGPNTAIVYEPHPAELMPTLSAKTLKRLAQKQRVKQRGTSAQQLVQSRSMASRLHGDGSDSRKSLPATSEDDSKTMTSHQEYAMQVMTDFFSRRCVHAAVYTLPSARRRRDCMHERPVRMLCLAPLLLAQPDQHRVDVRVRVRVVCACVRARPPNTNVVLFLCIHAQAARPNAQRLP